MANILAVTVCVVLLGSACSEDLGSSEQHGSGERDARDTEGRGLRNIVNMLKRDVLELKKNAGVCKCKDPVVTFTAFFGPDSAFVPAGEIVVFPRAPENSGYNPNTGIFTAPVDGIYIVGVSIRPFDIDPTSPFGAVQVISRCPGGSEAVIGRLTRNNEGLPFDVSSLITVPMLQTGCEVFVRNEVDASFGTVSIFSATLINQVSAEGFEPLLHVK